MYHELSKRGAKIFNQRGDRVNLINEEVLKKKFQRVIFLWQGAQNCLAPALPTCIPTSQNFVTGLGVTNNIVFDLQSFFAVELDLLILGLL